MDNETIKSYLEEIKLQMYRGRFIDAFNNLGFVIDCINDSPHNKILASSREDRKERLLDACESHQEQKVDTTHSQIKSIMDDSFTEKGK